jgi:hypothetical protein
MKFFGELLESENLYKVFLHWTKTTQKNPLALTWSLANFRPAQIQTHNEKNSNPTDE